MFETCNSMGAMLQTSSALRVSISSVISDRLPAREWERALEIAGSAGVGKVVVDWTEL